MRLPLIITLVGLTACTAFPQLDENLDVATRTADYPKLQTLAPLLAQADAMDDTGQITATSVTNYATRIAALTTQANRLRGPVIDTATRARMRRGVAVPAAIR